MTSDSSKHGTRTFPWIPLGSLSQPEGGTGRFGGISETFELILTDEMRHNLFIAELSTWALAFIGFGFWATN
jgi:hypothetical protein